MAIEYYNYPFIAKGVEIFPDRFRITLFYKSSNTNICFDIFRDCANYTHPSDISGEWVGYPIEIISETANIQESYKYSAFVEAREYLLKHNYVQIRG